MEPHIRQIFTSAILDQILGRYELSSNRIEPLDGFESFIFSVTSQEDAFILRVGHDSRRSIGQVRGEVEFLQYLAGHGLSVPKVFPSAHGNLVESCEAADGTAFLSTLFSKAPGGPPEKNQWQPVLFHKMGKLMGKLHHHSQHFTPSKPHFTRHDIEDDFSEIERIAQKYLKASDQPLLEAYRETIDTIRQLPKNCDSYGLCHVDFHRGNFFLSDDGRITLFDFDDCQYAWFIYDIAMALFYAIPHDCTKKADLDQAASFLNHFWSGYRQEYHLDPVWLKQIPLFLRLREIDLAILIHRSMNLEDLDPWSASYMDGRREKILNQVPYCPLDYDAIACSSQR